MVSSSVFTLTVCNYGDVIYVCMNACMHACMVLQWPSMCSAKGLARGYDAWVACSTLTTRAALGCKHSWNNLIIYCIAWCQLECYCCTRKFWMRPVSVLAPLCTLSACIYWSALLSARVVATYSRAANRATNILNSSQYRFWMLECSSRSSIL